jgi:glycerophosphoryl diester phosphodiesterase
MEVIAHRGASGHAPEHTFAAYDLALDQGADMLELDVRVARSGELVVLHDSTTHRIGREPLTLDDVLGRYGRTTHWLVELKDPHPAWEGRVVAMLREHGVVERAVVQSFDAGALRRLRREAPDLACAPLTRCRPPARRIAAASRYAAGIGVWHGSLDAAVVAAAHARGLAVRAWTVNTPAAIDRVVALGVDGVITDVPDAVVARRSAPVPLAA